MAQLEIRLLGDPVLREEAEPVETVDDDVRSLVEDMFETMYRAKGVGLAGPQVGVTRRIFVADLRHPDDEGPGPVALINPRVVEASDETEKDVEGCLSIPGLEEVVSRPARVVVEALDPEGEEVRIEAGGLLGRVLQHEIDHLDGVLFIDRVSPLKRRMLMKKWKKMEEAEEIPAPPPASA